MSNLIGKYLFSTSTLHGPDSNNVKRKIFRTTKGECYVMNPIAHICPLHSQGK